MQLNDKEANVDEIVSFDWITHFLFVIKSDVIVLFCFSLLCVE